MMAEPLQSASDQSSLDALGNKKHMLGSRPVLSAAEKVLPTRPKKKHKACSPLLRNIVEMVV